MKKSYKQLLVFMWLYTATSELEGQPTSLSGFGIAKYRVIAQNSSYFLSVKCWKLWILI